jgi:uncharacterized protein (TIGR03086 family)
MEPVEQATTAVALLKPLVENTDASQLANQTPCSDWRVRDLINHLAGGGHMFAASFRGDTVDMSAGEPDLVGDDHVAAMQASIDDFDAACKLLSDLDIIVNLPFGTMPADVALRFAAGDLLVHGWDLAQATGQTFDPPEDFVESVDGFYRTVLTDDMRGGVFAAAVEVSDDAPALDKLVAFAGRKP